MPTMHWVEERGSSKADADRERASSARSERSMGGEEMGMIGIKGGMGIMVIDLQRMIDWLLA